MAGTGETTVIENRNIRIDSLRISAEVVVSEGFFLHYIGNKSHCAKGDNVVNLKKILKVNFLHI